METNLFLWRKTVSRFWRKMEPTENRPISRIDSLPGQKLVFCCFIYKLKKIINNHEIIKINCQKVKIISKINSIKMCVSRCISGLRPRLACRSFIFKLLLYNNHYYLILKSYLEDRFFSVRVGSTFSVPTFFN